MLFATSASAITLTPTSCPLPGSNFQGGDGNQADGVGDATCPGNWIDWQTLAGISNPNASGYVHTLGDGDPFAPHPPHFGVGFLQKVLALEQQSPAGNPSRRREETQDGESERALARAGLADNA